MEFRRRTGGGRYGARHIEKGYIYFAMAFSLAVEVLNMRYHRRHPSLRSHAGGAG
jgi:hypothetical protein